MSGRRKKTIHMFQFDTLNSIYTFATWSDLQTKHNFIACSCALEVHVG